MTASTFAPAAGRRSTLWQRRIATLRRAAALLIASIVLPVAQALPPSLLAPWRGDAQPAPLELNSLDGRRMSLADLRGKVVLVNFWATWCAPCVEEMPSLQQLLRELEGEAFEILAVNLREGEPRIRGFLETMPLDFPILRDTDGAVARAWKIRIYPSTFVVDAEGRLRYSLVGATDWSAPAVQRPLRELLREARRNRP